MSLNTIPEILDDLRQGKMVIIMDDEDRENEGDLIIPAEAVKAEHVTFFARNACGLICLTITEALGKQLNLPLMVDQNKSQHATNFTVSIEAAHGTTTGISAADRATTVQAAVAEHAVPEDIVMPGHIFPLIAKPGGVLTRAGHTEAGCDLARMAGFGPSAMIVEIMNEDGTMAKREQLEKFSQKFDLKIGTIADLIEYRLANEHTIELIEEKKILTDVGEFKLRAYRDEIYHGVHLALIKGDIQPEQPVMVRVQTVNTLRDILGGLRPNEHRTWSLRDSLAKIEAEGSGVVVLVASQEPEDRLLEEIADFPAATPPPNPGGEGGLGVYRIVGTGSQILRDVGVRKMRLLSSPMKFNAISGFNLEVTEFVEND